MSAGWWEIPALISSVLAALAIFAPVDPGFKGCFQRAFMVAIAIYVILAIWAGAGVLRC